MMSLFIMGSAVVLAGTIANILGLVVILMYLIMVFKHDTYWFMSYGEFMLDSLSFLLILFSVWIGIFMYLSMNTGYYVSKLLKMVIASFFLFLAIAFSSINFIMFYVFFEASLLPTMILVLEWGYQLERTNVGTYMMTYTVAGSLLLLWGLMYMKSCGLTFMTLSSPTKIKGLLGLLCLWLALSHF